MELPNLGKNCSFWQCNKLDFLPVKCDACQNIFCKDHYSYVHHSCPNRHLRDNQIPMCPLCSKAVPVKFEKGETADQVVGRHIDNDCRSDAAEMKRKKVYNNRCNVKGCKQKEMIKFECYKCQLNFCLKHRLDIDHSCKGFYASGKNISKAGASALTRASEFFKLTTTNTPSTSQQQKRISALHVHSLQQPELREDEALNRAIELSLQESNNLRVSQTNNLNNDDEEAKRLQRDSDEALARALQESEMSMLQRTEISTGNSTTRHTNSTEKSCYIS